MDSIDYGNVYMPSMEDGNEGGMGINYNSENYFENSENSNSNSNETQTHIPVVDGFNQQMI